MESIGLVAGLAGEAAALLGVSALAARLQRAYRKEAVSAQRLREIFSRYVDPQLLQPILDHHDPGAFLGRNARVTILYCRIWNFTQAVERMPNAEVIRYLNELYALAGSTIHKHGGVIDRFLDDGIIGYFGAPNPCDDHEERAVRAALHIVRYIAGMESRWTNARRRPLRVGIGLNTGRVVVGETGFRDRRELVVVGREVLLAAKLQEATESHGAYIIASAQTYKPVEKLFDAIPASKVPLSGLKRLHDAYILQGPKNPSTDDALTMPPQSEFMTTTIEPDAPLPDSPEQLPVTDESAKVYVATPVAVRPQRTTLNVRRPHTGTRFEASDDDRPAMPDPPLPPHSVYEDGGGPPLELPP